MTDIEIAFLADIVAHPADDTPRLIYADWLEDNAGEVKCLHSFGLHSRCLLCGGTGRVPDGRAERAEFIRVQYEIARLEEAYGVKSLTHDSPTSDEWDALRRRQRELFGDHKCEWFGDSWAILYLDGEQEDAEGQYPDVMCAFISRGFVSGIQSPLRDWLEHGKSLRAAHPIEAATLTDVRPVRVNSGKWRFQFLAVEMFAEDGPVQQASVLPASFRPHMVRNSGTCTGSNLYACCYDYDAEADALADASAAALAWASPLERATARG